MKQRLLPYPLAPGDRTPEQPPAGPVPPEHAEEGSARPPRASRWPVLLLAAALVAALVAAATLAVLLAAESRRASDLEAELDETAQRAAEADAALRAAAGEPMSTVRANSAEVLAAAAGVRRFAGSGRSLAEGPEAVRSFVERFFGTSMESTNWTIIQRGQDVPTVLAKLDDPADPRVVWVSRRSLSTVDPGIPARTDCIALDVEVLVDSVVRNRPTGPAQAGAPLRWWPDVVRLVPPQECPK